MSWETLQLLWTTPISMKSGAMIVLFVCLLALARAAEWGVRKIRAWRKNDKLNHFCRWEGMHVPCFDVLSSLDDGVIVADAAGKILFLNRISEKMLGVSVDSVRGRHYRDILRLVDAEQPEKTIDLFAEVRRSGKPISLDRNIRVMSSDGKTYRTTDRVQAIFRAEAMEPHMIMVLHDVTAEYENAARLKAHHELWQQIINAIPTILFAKDADDNFKYVFCNKAFSAFVGKKQEEIVGKTDAELFPASETFVRYRATDRMVMELEQGERFEEQARDAQGKTHIISTFKRSITGINNKNLLLGVCTDITELHNLLQYEQVSNKVLTCAVTEAEFAPAIEKTLRTMMDCLNCDRVIFARLEADGRLHRFNSVYSPRIQPLEEAGLPLHERLWNFHLPEFKEGKVVLYEKFSDIPGSVDLLTQYPDYPIHSAVGAPVFIKDEFFGALLVSFVENHEFTELDKQTLGAITNMITLAQIRERQSKAVKLAEYHNQTILDNLDIPVWLYDNKGMVVRNNQAAEAMLKGQTIANVPFGCRDKLVCGVDEEHCPVHLCMTTGKEYICDNRHIGSRDFIAKARPIFDEAGNLTNVVKSYIDVTMLHHMIENQQLVNDCLANLMRENDAMKALDFSLKDVCAHLGANRCFIMKFDSEQQQLSKILNYSSDGHSCELDTADSMPYSKAPEFESYFRSKVLLAAAELPDGIEKFGLASWEDLFAQCRVRSFYAHRIMFEGKLWGLVGFFYEDNPKLWAPEELHFFGALAYGVELTLIRQKNQHDILDALEKAKAADHAKGIFLASMSHEIRTPLNAVIGFSELLKDETLPPKELREYLAGIYSAGNSLLALINDVLDLSKLEAGQMEFSNTPISFRGLLLDVGGIFRQKCAERNIYFAYDIPDDLPTLWLDKLRIRQILFNLIGNAVKFTTHGGITVRARFTPLTDDHGTLVFHIIDTGCGISEHDQQSVFGLFVQATALRGTQAANNGTGLGLAICKRLTEQMDGSIEFVSESGKGTDFFVTLRNIRYDAAAATSGERTTELKPHSANLNALLVDDVPMNLKVMAAMLKKIGLRSVSVNSAPEALLRLKQEKFDFVLTDMWMPNMNGAELLAAIRKGGTQSRIPVFAVTADIEANTNFKLDDFSGVLLKPVALTKLQNLVARIAAAPDSE